MDPRPKRSQAEKIRRRFTRLMQPLGFRRTKTSFWTRGAQPTVEFVHLHLYSFAPEFRLHVGVRVLNDPFEALALNGPASHQTDPYDHEFNESEESVVRCAYELARYCEDRGEPWFSRWRPPTTLLAEGSPLEPLARAALERALRGALDEPSLVRSRSLLGVA